MDNAIGNLESRTDPEPVVHRTPAHQIPQKRLTNNVLDGLGLPSSSSLAADLTYDAPNKQLTNDLDLGSYSTNSSPMTLRFDSSTLLRVTRAFNVDRSSSQNSLSMSVQSTSNGTQMPATVSSGDGYLTGRVLSSSKDNHMAQIDKRFSVTPTINFNQLNPSLLDLDHNEERRDDDPEGVTQLMWVSPTMDAQAPDNFLPLVLQNFARWVPLVMFEPLRIAQCTKEHITNYFSTSDASRARIMLLGRIFGMLSDNPVLDSKGQSIVSVLRADLNRATSVYTSTRPSLQPDIARIQAGNLLTRHLENVTMQAPIYPLSDIFRLLREATPIFRYACLDPPGLPVYLPGLLMDPESNLRHFVSLDVVLSVTSGQRTSCEYEIGFSLGLCDRVMRYQEHYGFQWLQGVPDQFILLLAWINALYERQGVNVEPRVLVQIENELSTVELLPVDSADPALKVGRTVVQECWRHATYIYLYMTLYGAHSKDPRVERTLKSFMRLVNGINPGRNPDSFLAAPMIVAGVAASKQRDRATIRRRILGLKECQTPASSWNDHVQMLEDVWTRTFSEGRAAKWTDLRIACQRVTGI